MLCLCLMLCFVGCNSSEHGETENGGTQITEGHKANENPFAGGLVNGGTFEGH